MKNYDGDDSQSAQPVNISPVFHYCSSPLPQQKHVSEQALVKGIWTEKSNSGIAGFSKSVKSFINHEIVYRLCSCMEKDFIVWLDDIFSVVPETSTRKMFGGVGIFHHGLMFALATSEGRIAMKADQQTIEDFQAQGCEEWQYSNKVAKNRKFGYWYIPDYLLEDSDALHDWALKAFDVAVRADRKKPPPKRKYSA